MSQPDSAAEARPGVVQDRPATSPRTGPSPVVLATVSLAAGVCFVVLAVWISRRGQTVPRIDAAIHSWVLQHRSPRTLTLARTVTWGGVTGVVLPALAAVGVLAAGRRVGLGGRLWAGALLVGVAGVGVFVGLRVNAFVGRARPPVADWAGAAGGHSFPSGHTTAATLFAVSCACALTVRLAPGWPRRAVWTTAFGYAVAVGWSRVWLGVHWPTDVVGGWLFGLCFGGGVAALLLRRRATPGRSQAVVAPGR